MGTQQILLIVLSVIIVGIAVSVGITMFNAQATNSNRQAIVGDMNNFAAQSLAFYKTPTSHGGGGNAWGTVDELGMWLGYGYNATTDSLGTGNGSYKITDISGEVLTIVGTGTQAGNNPAYHNTSGETGKVAATMIVHGDTDEIEMTLDN